MIDPKLLTPENGFQYGVVVEITDDCQRVFVGRLSHVTEWNIWFVESNFHGFTFKEVHSIRPLTGPMAIWNFSGKNTHLAMVITEDEMEQLCWWRPDTVDFEEWKRVWTDFGAVVTEKPWWAKDGE